MGGGRKMAVFCILVVSLATTSKATLQDDEAECAEQLTSLAACIPFVSGSAKKPTPECCQDTVKLKASKPKCLCVLIKESTDPSMGLPINTTLALQMPSACNIDASVSNCPSLLNLSPDSPDAKIFKEADSGSDSSATTTTTTSAKDSPSTSSGSSSSSSPSDSSAKSDPKPTTESNEGAKMTLNGVAGLMLTALAAWNLFI